METEGAFFNISDFELRPNRLDKGEYSSVFVAKNVRNGQEYAAKIINVENGFDGNDQMLFLRESLTLRTLDHPCITKFVGINFGSFKDPKLLEPSIITENFLNRSLKDNLNKEKKPLSDDIWNPTKKYIILLGINDAMRYLHKNNILHRDLKPENILLDEKLHPRVCNFSFSKYFSKSLNKSTKLTKSGQFYTQLYSPPEILRGGENYDQSVDVYAFSMIAYEMVTGREPFSELGESISPYGFIQRIINGHRPKFTKLVTKKMRKLLSRCWSDRPEERPTFEFIFDELSSDFSYFNEEVNKEEIEEFIKNLKDHISKEEENITEIKQLSPTSKLNENERIKLEGELQKLKNKINEYEKEKDVLSKTNNFLNDGLCLIFGNKKYRNTKSAINELKNSSKGGNRYASFILGLLYESGDEIEQDMKKSFKYYEKSYKQGNSCGYVRIGFCYKEGKGVKQNYTKAIEYYEKAAEFSDSFALNNLGLLYEEGKGVKQNYKKAIEYYEKAADLGNSSALNNLGLFYEEGKGIKKNYKKAIECFEQAVQLGNSSALYNLGDLYENGVGVKKNYTKAIDYFEQAAKLGDEDAEERIASIKKIMMKK